MSRLYILALTGPVGSGKDTAASFLREMAPKSMVIAPADALYDEVCAAFGVRRQDLQARQTKEIPNEALALWRCADAQFVKVVRQSNPSLKMNQALSPRHVLQWWGTEYRRAENPSYWTQRLAASIESRVQQSRQPLLVLCPGVRFANEERALSEVASRYGGQMRVVMVLRRLADLPPNANPRHASEMYWREQCRPDDLIFNFGSLDDLAVQSRALLAPWAAQLPLSDSARQHIARDAKAVEAMRGVQVLPRQGQTMQPSDRLVHLSGRRPFLYPQRLRSEGIHAQAIVRGLPAQSSQLPMRLLSFEEELDWRRAGIESWQDLMFASMMRGRLDEDLDRIPSFARHVALRLREDGDDQGRKAFSPRVQASPACPS